MKIIVNGQEHTVPEGMTLEEFLSTKRISKEDKGIAVAVNDTVVPKSNWASVRIEEGDQIEIVRAVQGGLQRDALHRDPNQKKS